MNGQKPVFESFALIVRDMSASLAFYRLLGMSIPEGADREVHVEIELRGGVHVQFDTVELMKGYDPRWQEPTGGSRTLLVFNMSSREAVDEVFEELTAAGYKGHQAPFDAFWGSRYGVVNDPDGNLVGLRSPRDPARVSRPPL